MSASLLGRLLPSHHSSLLRSCPHHHPVHLLLSRSLSNTPRPPKGKPKGKTPKDISYQLNGQISSAREWKDVLGIYSSQHSYFNGVNWATAMSKLGRITPGQMPALKRQKAFSELIDDLVAAITASSRLQDFAGARQVATILHSLGKLGEPSEPIHQLVESNAKWLVSSAKPQEVAMAAWAFATHNLPAPNFFSAIEANAPKFMSDAKPKEIAIVAWAFAILSTPAPSLFSLIERDSATFLSTGNPRDFANTAWAFATLGIPAPILISHLDANATSFVENANPMDISNVMWACATLNIPAPSLFTKVNLVSESKFKYSSTQAIANTAWAVGHLAHDAPILLSTIDNIHSESLVNEGTPQAIANTARAFAIQNIKPKHFFAHLEKKSEQILKEANLPEVSNICLALASLDLLREHDALLQACWACAVTLGKNLGGLERRVLRRLFQVELHAKSSSIELLSPVPRELRDQMMQAATEDRHRRVSTFCYEISNAMKKIGFQHGREVSAFERPIGNKMLLIDIGCSKTKVAVECDGPSHFLSSGREKGKTVAKRRLLERMGWRVVNISYVHNNKFNDPKFLEANKHLGDREELQKLFTRKSLERIGVFL